MNVENLLDQIEDVLDSGTSMPLSSKILVDAKAIRTYLDDIRANLPQEIQKAQKIVEDRQALISNAQEEAKATVNDAQEKADKVRENRKPRSRNTSNA
jgi:cell division septum initiation protein DivIVA